MIVVVNGLGASDAGGVPPIRRIVVRSELCGMIPAGNDG